MLRKLYLILAALLYSGVYIYAQTTALKATVIDKSNGETIPFAAVVILQKTTQIGSGQADINGEVTIKPLNPGTYTVQAQYLGFAPVQLNNVAIQEGKTTYIEIKMDPSVKVITEFQKVEYVVPLVDRNKTVNQSTVTRTEFMKLGSREIGAVVSLAAGTFQKNEGGSVSIRGARNSETRAGNGAGENSTKTFIDGQRVIGNAGVAQSAVEQVSVIISGVPAEFGDATSGVINITTRGPGPNYFGGIEAISSQGLDKFGHNYISFNSGGPILFKKDADNVKQPILGFFLGGEFLTDKDGRPSYDGNWKVKDSVADFIERNPYRLNPEGGVLKNADFLNKNDFELIPYRQNVRTNSIKLNAKLDFAPTKMFNLTVGGNYTYNKYKGYTIATDRNNSLLNPQANQLNMDKTWRVWGRIRQKFGEQGKDEKSSSNIRNAFYTLQGGYTVVDNVSQDEQHRDNFQNYGYIGKFKTYKTNSWALGFDKSTGRYGYLLTSQDVDTLVEFTPDTVTNPLLTRYTQQYMGFVKDLGAANWYNSPTTISNNGGLINGDPDDQLAALRVYNLWYNTGQKTDSYSKIYNTQFRVTASFSADIKSHAIQVGFEYEQRNESGYNFKPSAMWRRARQLANNHISQIDNNTPYIRYNGNGILADSIYYSRKFEKEKYTGFAKNIREQLGVADTAFLQVDNINKDDLNIKQFSADDLFAGGSDNENLLSNGYYGFDVYGNRLTGGARNVAFKDFWSAKDSKGNATRAVGSFKPIYIAGYIQDNFDFRDIKFNIGVRVDYFDANQKVLTDPYSFYATKKAAEITKINNEDVVHPDFIKDDGQNYVVYGDKTDAADATQIFGYRNINTNKWFDKDGNALSDPKVLADKAGGLIQPFLDGKDSIKSSNFDPTKSFSDYKAQTNFMPRIAFSFPISDQANFFAHYDVLTQRPPARLRMDPTDYYFLQNNNQLPINNANLKPEKNIDYEIGFAQVLNESQNSAITISAFYREMRNMIQVVRVAYAYPISYLTYGNIDFGTVKGLTFKYDLRRTRNVAMSINYTLQFAEGTGSSSTDAFSLLSSGQPNLRSVTPLDIDQRHTLVTNLDYRYGSGAQYDGPRWFGTNFLENTGANLTFRAGSGIPYTRNRNIQRTADIGGAAGTSNIDGSLNGSRLPSTFRIDARFDRSITLKFGRKDSENRKEANLNVYLQILNLLNTRNVIEAYKATGNPNDDGYLSADRFQNDINTQINPASYRDFYNMKVNDPRNFSLPRRIRVGATLDF